MPNIMKPTGINAIWSENGQKVDPGAVKVGLGWVTELPPYQTANFIEYKQDLFNAHVNQHGIPEWDSVTEYQGNLSYTQGANGIIYKCLRTHSDKIPTDPLNITAGYWRVAFEDAGETAKVQANLDRHVTNYNTLSGIGNVVIARQNLSVYSKAEGDARYAMKHGNGSNVFSVATATQPTHAIPLSQLSTLVPPATETVAGVMAVATTIETEAGANDTKAVSPLKAAQVYLKKKDNLSGLSNVTAARANLGLSDTATMPSSTFLKAGSNLADVPNKALARSNLGITSSATQPETYFLRSAQNLADVPNKAQARVNLGLTGMATTDPAAVMMKADNLAGLANTATARSNLGLGTASTRNTGDFLSSGANLSDLTNVQAARNNLGLKGAATLDVWGLPANTTAMDFQSNQSDISRGWARLPNGLLLQWGTGPGLSDDTRTNIQLPVPARILNVQVTVMGTFNNSIGPGAFMTDMWSNTGFRVSCNWGNWSYPFNWFAITSTL
ncbi:tail fiber protein [Pseudomonas phage HJ01]|uniref:tail fiber protein n=1 Tax=Pseudomonas phage HJ01 TaxID=3018995 RepID=UPI0024429C2A|nr:tail fiber protein [Pseudomonas phage HJ01]WBM36203.1 tail fiber protein [Pseudomonas phage HJ01]